MRCEAPHRQERGDGGWSGGRTAIFSAVPHINAHRKQFYWRGVQPRKWSGATVLIASVVELHRGSCAHSVGGGKKADISVSSTCIFIYIYIKDTEQRFVLKPNSSSVWRGSVDQELGAQLSCKNAPCGFSSEQQLSASAQERLRAEK